MLGGGGLIVVDMQQFFFVENHAVDVQRLTAACRDIMDVSRRAGVPVIRVETHYRDDGADWPRAFRGDKRSWCSNLTQSCQLAESVEGLSPAPGDVYVSKTRFSAFYNTNLEDILRALEVEHIYLIGYSADVCLRFTAVDAYNRGFQVTLVDEGIEAFRESKDASAEYLRWLIAADCISREAFEAGLHGPGAIGDRQEPVGKSR